MGRKRMPGLTQKGEIWHINKKINGQRIHESTGTSDLKEAEKYLVHRLEEIRQASIYGVRPKRTFREAAVKFVEENGHKATLCKDIIYIKQLDPFIGHLTLEMVHMGSLQPYIQHKRKQQVKARTLNNALQITRRILNLAATEWMDEHGLTWLVSAPKIKLFPETDRRPPYPLSWDEQKRFFDELPEHLLKMSLFTVNTGCRKTEVCNLRWEYEVFVPELGYSVFVIPGSGVKNRQDRVIVLNDVARSIVEEMRGQHSEFVFTYDDPKVGRRKLVSMLRSAWRKAREKIGLPQLRVHDLKHTFGRRLRSNKVCFEDRQDLLGHKSSRVTTDYSAAEILNLIDMANKACTGTSTPALTTLLKWRNSGSRAKVAKSNLGTSEIRP